MEYVQDLINDLHCANQVMNKSPFHAAFLAKGSTTMQSIWVFSSYCTGQHEYVEFTELAPSLTYGCRWSGTNCWEQTFWLVKIHIL